MDKIVANIANEMLTVGSFFTQPDLFVEYGQHTKSKYDFFDEVTRFFYDAGEIIYLKRSQIFNKTVISTFMAEDQDRLAQYKQYGGWDTISKWMSLTIPDNFKNYFEVLKKFSLLREYQRNGFAVDKIINHSKFETFSALDIYRLVRGKVDRINTVILSNQETEILNYNIIDLMNECLQKPDMGLSMPFPILNSLFRGMKTKTMMAVGMLSNAGKTRFMIMLIAYIALVQKEKVTVLLNEMTVDEIKFALLTTVINNEEFQKLHGVRITKKEREITLGLYKNAMGNFIYREQDEWCNFTESAEEYQQRLIETSSEYVSIAKVAKWIEEESQGTIFVKDISSTYDDQSLEFEIRKASLIHGCRYVFYDTLKNDTDRTGEWAALKTTTTKMTEWAKQLDIFIYGSVQMTDDSTFISPDELTSNNIANCKQIKHPLHVLLLFLEIPKKDYRKYGYLSVDQDWGEPRTHDLNENKRYGIFNVDKNRFGAKEKIIVEYDLDLNTWTEKGRAVHK